MLTKYDPFDDPIYTKGLYYEDFANVHRMKDRARERWITYQALTLVGSFVLGVTLSVILLILHCYLASMLALAAVLPIRLISMAVGRKFLVRQALQQIKDYGDTRR